MRNVISFLNMKGGVCKTTLCKEMTLYLAEIMQKKVLIIDIDPQANCTQSFFERFEILNYGEGEIFTESPNLPSIEKIFSPSAGKLQKAKKEEVILEITDNIHMIPGELHTIFMERETGSGAAEQRLYNFVSENKLREIYDYIFIDCPPTYSFYTTAALLASDLYLVPVVPDAYSLLGVNLLQEVVKHLKDSYVANFNSQPLDNLGIIFTKIKSAPSYGIKSNIKQIKEALKEDGIDVFDEKLIRADKIITSKLSTFILDRTDETLKENLKKICEEFINKVGEYNG